MIIVGWLLGFPGWAPGADLVVEVIRLHHRSADQILPLIQPLATPGTVSGAGRDIVVRTSRGSLETVKKVVAQLDRPPRRLIVTVRLDADPTRGPRAAAPSQSFGTHGADSDRAVQRVQTIDGGFAYVYVGQSVPVLLQGGGRRVSPGGREAGEPVTVIRETLSGFALRPRLNGEVVTLDIEPRHDVPGAGVPGSVDVQRIATTVLGPVGTWIELGSIQPVLDGPDDGVTYSTRRVDARVRRILVRVDAVD